MAIVKFVSDKDCVVFIDMELAGKVAPDSMLKVTLESGGYLIQIKDDDGHLIKEYDLEIKASDNQVLQKINESNCQIEGVIRNLRNDSSLRFYHQRAIFCYNGNYGYINSQYKIAIDPVYSYVENFTNLKALVKKVFPDGEKANIIDLNGNICHDRWFDYIGSGEKTILLKSEKVFYVLSKVDYSIVNQYIDAKYNGKGPLIPVHQHFGDDDMYGYIDRTGTEVIPLIYDYVWNYEESGYAKVKRFGLIHIIGKDGTLYFNSDQKSCISKEESCTMGFSFEALPAIEYWPKLVDNKWCLVSSKVEMFFDENGEYTGDYEYNKNEYEIVYEFERIFYFNGEIASGRVNGKCVLLKLIPTIVDYSFDAIKIIPNTYYDGYSHIMNIVALKNDKYGMLDLKGHITVPFDYDDIQLCPQEDYKLTQYAIVSKDGKFSIIDTNTGNLKIPFEYDSIEFNKSNIVHNEIICYFAKKGNFFYSCLNYEGNKIKNIVCEHFKYECKIENDENDWSSLQILFLEKSGKHGLCLIYHPCDMMKFYKKLDDINVMYLEPVYDECVLCKSDSKYAVLPTIGMPYVAVRLESKWGIIDGSMYHNYNLFDDSWFLWPEPNLYDLVFKYDTLSELQDDADSEFLRRYIEHSNYDE